MTYQLSGDRGLEKIIEKQKINSEFISKERFNI